MNDDDVVMLEVSIGYPTATVVQNTSTTWAEWRELDDDEKQDIIDGCLSNCVEVTIVGEK